MFNLGFAVFTTFSVLLSITWMHGSAAALWLILMRVGQGVGGALLFANSSAILTDAFPQNQRGLALGVNSIAAIAGSFIALVLIGVMVGITYGIQPYGGHTMGWTSPFVLATLLGGVAVLVLFCLIEL